MGQIIYTFAPTKEQAGVEDFVLDLKALKTGVYICEAIGKNNYKRIKLIKK